MGEMIYIIAEQLFMHIPLIFGSYISFSLLKVPDLSLESAYIFGALCGAKMLIATQTLPIFAALIITLLVSLLGGLIVGMISSLLTQKANFPHLLSCIITFGVFHGINQLVAGSYISLTPFRNLLALPFTISHHPELLMLGMIALILTILLFFLLERQFGYCLGIYGNNKDFLTNYGISGSFVFIAGIMLSNALSGLSGFLVSQSTGFVELNMALGKALLCITALILGKALVNTKKPIMLAIPLVGVMSYFSLQQFLLKVGFNLKYFTTIQSIIILCILITQLKHQKKAIDHLGV